MTTAAVPTKQFTNSYSEQPFDVAAWQKDPNEAAYGCCCMCCQVGQIVADSNEGDCVKTAAILSAVWVIPSMILAPAFGAIFGSAMAAGYVNKVRVT